MNLYRNQELLSSIKPAFSISQRFQGLMGEKNSEKANLWIKPCNSIHTFFMNFAIDAIFVNKELQVVSLHENLKPYRVTKISLKAHSVFEFKSGFINQHKIKIGDSFRVDH